MWEYFIYKNSTPSKQNFFMIYDQRNVEKGGSQIYSERFSTIVDVSNGSAWNIPI